VHVHTRNDPLAQALRRELRCELAEAHQVRLAEADAMDRLLALSAHSTRRVVQHLAGELRASLGPSAPDQDIGANDTGSATESSPRPQRVYRGCVID